MRFFCYEILYQCPGQQVKTPAGQTSSMDKTELNIQIEERQCVTQEDGSKRWQCLQCDKSYTTKHNLMTHMLGHNGIKPHCCLVRTLALYNFSWYSNTETVQERGTL